METLDTLMRSGYPIESIVESFDYSIARELTTSTHESFSSEKTKELALSGKYQVLNGFLQLSNKDSESDILKFCQHP